MTKASLIVIGSELTRGIIQDKHTILVSHELSKMGIHFSESVVIPDDGTIREVIGALLRNNNIVLLTGGLGPTTDDMTRSAIAEAAGVELVRDEGAWNHLLETLEPMKSRLIFRRVLISFQIPTVPLQAFGVK